MDDKITTGSQLLQRAVDFESNGRLIEAVTCYTEGLQIYLQCMNGMEKGAKKTELTSRIEHFMQKAETLKKRVKIERERSTYHEEIKIRDNDIGHSYESVFGKLFSDKVTQIKVEDPYIMKPHQLINFQRFCELAVRKCKNLQKVLLVTQAKDMQSQEVFFQALNSEFRLRGIQFSHSYLPTLHDRLVSLNNGWMIKLGKGLDYFKPTSHNRSLGYFDMDLRPCHQTNIDIYFDQSLKNVSF